MRFMDWIVELLYDVCLFFYDIYQEVKDWPDWASFISEFFYSLYDAFYDLAKAFEDFDEWVDDVADRVRDILDFENIWDYFEDWFTWAEDAWNWVEDAWDRVTNIVDEWWLVTSSTVAGWIAAATEGFDELKEAWDDFWTNTLPTLISFDWLSTWWEDRLLDIQDLIDAPVKTIMDILESWQEVRDSVLEFFSDPFQWIYDRLDEFFERFW